MNLRDLLEIAKLLEELDQLIHEYPRALTAERREMLEAEILTAKEQLKVAATGYRN